MLSVNRKNFHVIKFHNNQEFCKRLNLLATMILYIIDQLLLFQIHIFNPSSNVIMYECPYDINWMETSLVSQVKIRVR